MTRPRIVPVPEWKLVPTVEYTTEMVDAFEKAYREAPQGSGTALAFDLAYRAMVAVAPPPPPPADLKASAWMVRGAQLLRAYFDPAEACAVAEPFGGVVSPLFDVAAIAAAHAAGKAEGGVELLKQARRVRNFSAPEQVFEAVPVSMFGGKEIADLTAERATARAEALAEALAAAKAAGAEACKGFVLIGPAGIVMRMLAAIRSLASNPPAPREA